MKRFKKFIMAFILVSMALTGLSASGKSEEDSKLKVVASTSIITDVVANIAGDKVQLTGLMGPSRDPHSYEPTPRDMAKVEEADILFINGFDLEEGLISVLKTVSTKEVVEVSSTILSMEHEEDSHEEDGHDEEHQHGGTDPHSWMSPLNVVHWVEVIRDALMNADPANADYYLNNAAIYTEKLLQLHKEIRESLSPIPGNKRILVTDHESLGYFADEYDLKIIGTILPQNSTGSDTSARHLAALVKLMADNQVKALFIGNTAGADIRKLSGAISGELGYKIEIFQLLSGSLQKKGEPGDSYLDYMRFNTNLIKEGLTR